MLEASLPSFLLSLFKKPFSPLYLFHYLAFNNYYCRIRKKKLVYLLLFISIIYFDVCQFRYYKVLSL